MLRSGVHLYALALRGSIAHSYDTFGAWGRIVMSLGRGLWLRFAVSRLAVSRGGEMVDLHWLDD